MVRAEGVKEGVTEPGPLGRGNGPATPSPPPVLSGTEIPLGVITSTAPLLQGKDKPVSERIAYVCQDCGYVYDQETPFEDVSDEYNCPRTFPGSPHSLTPLHVGSTKCHADCGRLMFVCRVLVSEDAVHDGERIRG